MRHQVVVALLVASASLLVVDGRGGASDAEACGGFFSPRRIAGNRKPSMAYEQTLIAFDPGSRREHFVREVTFRRSRERFGFVVPTPSRPEVAAVKQSPFRDLLDAFPFTWMERHPIGHGGGGSGSGYGRGAGAGVRVLEVTRVGSFTAFVLAATDERALSNWLAQNGLVSTPEADRWLAHYVRMQFFYVAMRYEPPGGESRPETKAETMRISFDTPLPYYPYFEPEPPAGQAADPERLLEIWLVSTEEFVPVAARTHDDRVRWVQPFAEGEKFLEDQRAVLEPIVGAALLPAQGTPIVQRFMDQKVSRAGFGDVLFVPRNTTTPDAALRSSLLHALPILDPSLAEAP